MSYAASLKLDPRVDRRKKHRLIEEALAMLSLLKKKDAVVGSIEKKVSLDLELLEQLRVL